MRGRGLKDSERVKDLLLVSRMNPNLKGKRSCKAYFKGVNIDYQLRLKLR